MRFVPPWTDLGVGGDIVDDAQAGVAESITQDGTAHYSTVAPMGQTWVWAHVLVLVQLQQQVMHLIRGRVDE